MTRRLFDKPSIYVAASYSKDRERASRFIRSLQGQGYTITHDWTGEVAPAPGTPSLVREAINRRQATDDFDAASEADVLVLFYSPGMRGAWIEVGAALANLAKVLIIGQPEQAESFIFLTLMSGVVADEDEALAWLAQQRADDVE